MEAKLSKKERIEQKATTLFKERGYAATSMRHLADHIGIEAASLYSHIRSKEEILQKVCFRMAEDFFRAIAQVKGDTATARLKSAIIQHIKVITRDPDATVVFNHEWRHLSEPHLSAFIGMRNNYEARFLSFIEEGMQNGELAPTDPKLTAVTILSSLNSVYAWYRPGGKLSAEQIGEQISSILFNGLIKS